MAPFIRIFLRYITMPLLYFGAITADEASDIIADPELLQWISLFLGMAAPVVTESWYWIARKMGWEK